MTLTFFLTNLVLIGFQMVSLEILHSFCQMKGNIFIYSPCYFSHRLVTSIFSILEFYFLLHWDQRIRHHHVSHPRHHFTKWAGLHAVLCADGTGEVSLVPLYRQYESPVLIMQISFIGVFRDNCCLFSYIKEATHK